MEKIYSEVEITSWDRNEYPGGYPNPTGPNNPGRWHPEAIRGHGLYLLTEEDWQEVKEIGEEPSLLADFFQMDPVIGKEENYEIKSVAYERMGDYAIVVATQVGDDCFEYDIKEEIKDAKRRLCTKRSKCHDCSVMEGEPHLSGCDVERCPFCGGQSLSCDCIYHEFYPDELPEEVYENGPPDEIEKKWRALIEKKGKIPHIVFPVFCALCGEPWPDIFMRDDWHKVVPGDLRNKVLCFSCYKDIKKKPDMPRPTLCCKCGKKEENDRYLTFNERSLAFAEKIAPLTRENAVCNECYQTIQRWIKGE